MTLKDEILAGPLVAELADAWAGGADATIVTILNQPRYDVYGDVSRAVFAMWCGSTGLRTVIQQHADNLASPLNAAALTILDFLRGGVAESIDFAIDDNQQMLGAWVSADGISQAQADELLAMSLHKISRAEQAGLVVNVDTVSEARK